MNMNGWDMISVIEINQVNIQLQKRMGELLVSFDTHWDDAFAGQYRATGKFGAWSLVGGSGSDIWLMLPITSGSLSLVGGADAATDISGMTVELEVNLEWIPSKVTQGAKTLQFDLSSIAPPNGPRPPGGIFVKSVSDPKKTGFGPQVGKGIASALLENKDKITFVFAETGIVDPKTATWLLPKRSTYSYHSPQGIAAFLAILSVTTDRDISGLNSNVDSGLANARFPVSLAISGGLFLENGILPVLPHAFPNTDASTFSYANGTITLRHGFNLNSIREGLIDYTPTVNSLSISINSNALKSLAAGTCGLHLPNAYLDFSTTTNNVLAYNAASQTFSFLADPNPVTGSNSHVPWYDYLIGLGPIGAAVMACVLAAVESGLSGCLSSTQLAGSLASAPASTVVWAGLDQIKVQQAELNDCLVLHASVN
jgi:hypothetical protein